jgi:mandelate racemase
MALTFLVDHTRVAGIWRSLAMHDLAISSVQARPVMVPLRRPIIAAIGKFDIWPLVLVDVTTEGGITGHAYIAPYRARAMHAIVDELHELSELLKGQPAAPQTIFDGNLAKLNVVGETGISLIATAALDMALWDVLAKSAGLPLAELLGGTVDAVPTYNSNGLWRHDISTLAEEAAALRDEGGFTAMKMRLGAPHASADLAAIAEVRKGIGDEIDLMVDFNQALGTGDAIRRCHELDDAGLYWFEEPIDYSNVRGYAQLASKVRTPLQMGENYYGVRDLFTFLAEGAVHYAMVDLMRIGGITGWIRSAGLAAGAGVQLSSHLYPEISSHLMRVTPTAHWLEWVDWASPILAAPMKPQDGFATPSSAPGTGLEWDEDAVAHYLVK